MEGKKIALFLIFCCLLVYGAAAYIVTLSTPRTINVGEPIVVNGTSNLPPGFTTTVTLSRTGAFGIITQKEVTIQEGGAFQIRFDSSGMEQATYKVEIQEKEYTYGTGSTTWVFVTIINRINELELSSPKTQPFDGTLDIEGTIRTVGNSGLRLEVVYGNATIFGPEYIATRNGAFQERIPVEEGGIYTVYLVDNTSYRWTIPIQVTVPTPVPTTTTVIPTTTALVILQASASASRMEPAYLKVDTNIGTLRASTSSGVDWVIEYIDESGKKDKINVRGTDPEEITLNTRGGIVYLKVYPDQFGERTNVTLYVENARNVEVCPTCATMFGDVAPTTTTPLPAILALLAVLVSIGLWIRRT